MKYSEIRKLANSLNFGTKGWYKHVAQKAIDALEEIPDEKIVSSLENGQKKLFDKCYKYYEKFPDRKRIFEIRLESIIFSRKDGDKFDVYVESDNADTELLASITLPNLYGVDFIALGLVESHCLLHLKSDLLPKEAEDVEEQFKEIFGDDLLFTDWTSNEREHFVVCFKIN